MSERNVLTVSQVNMYVKMLLDTDEVMQSVWVRGEISNFTNHYKSGHLYFSLKDPDGAVKCVMFKSAAAGLKFVPADGMKVLLAGRVSAFPRDGVYQIYVEEMQPDGFGNLYLAFEQLKKKLEAEGLFSPARKRKIPAVPARIGIITSPTGAAIHDMITVTGRRFPAARILLYPALVQGPEAPRSLIAGLAWFNSHAAADVIIIGRGGGSMEDLWAFNNESLARAVAASSIPVISAVGHESDVTICDLVADVRAATPSAAAELAVPDRVELSATVASFRTRLDRAVDGRIGYLREKWGALASHRAMMTPMYQIEERRMAIDTLSSRLDARMDLCVRDAKNAFGVAVGKLETLNPLSVLSRGYSVTDTGVGGKVITSLAQVRAGDTVRIRFRDGAATASILDCDINDTTGKGSLHHEQNSNENER